MAFTEARES